MNKISLIGHLPKKLLINYCRGGASMRNRVKQYLDELFCDIFETDQLIELKEEMTSNLLDKINDFITNGDIEDVAFKKAVSGLGDMHELIDNFKKASENKIKEDFMQPKAMDRKHVIGYVLGSIFAILGLIAAAIGYAFSHDYRVGLTILFSTIILSTILFVLLGLTQDTIYTHGMKASRAFRYAISSSLCMASIFVPLMIYLYGSNVYIVLFTFIALGIPSIATLIYLGLTEKNRSKLNMLDLEWQNQWLEYYMHPQTKIKKDYWSGALWIFTTALFLVGILTGVWYSWIIFIFAAGFQVLIEGYFQSKSKH